MAVAEEAAVAAVSVEVAAVAEAEVASVAAVEAAVAASSRREAEAGAVASEVEVVEVRYYFDNLLK